MRPLIGISLCLDERGRWRPGRRYQYLDVSYAGALDAAGATPLYLPLQAKPEALLERIDGLLLPGGDDFAPPHPYPAEVHFDPAPRAQLEFDRRLLAGALERELPVLGVCYGMQLLALLCGGSLLYDVPSDVPGAGNHQLDERSGRHALVIEPGSRLAGLLGPGPTPVNSLHHQAVAEPGSGLRVVARAEDGLIEAIEGTGGGFCLGVQWHPEKLEAGHRDRLFGAFAQACAERRDRPGGAG